MDSSKFWQKNQMRQQKRHIVSWRFWQKRKWDKMGKWARIWKRQILKKKANFRSIFDPRSGKMACCRSRLQLSSKIERSIFFQSNIFCELDFVQWPICELHRTLSSPACRLLAVFKLREWHLRRKWQIWQEFKKGLAKTKPIWKKKARR